MAAPGRWDVIVGAVLGTGTAGLFTTVALAVLSRIKSSGGDASGTRLVGAFAGLMLARMVGYGALVIAAVVLGAGDPVSVAVGLVGGTVVFLALEILYVRKMT